jgi:integron integrase
VSRGRLGGTECAVAAFLSSLATDQNVSASTQNQALAAILFLYEAVLDREIDPLPGVIHAKRLQHLPVVMTRREVAAVLARLRGVPRLMASLLYGAGVRLLECAMLRVKDVNLDAAQLLVRRGKGSKDRVTMIPQTLIEPITLHLGEVEKQHQMDLERGAGYVELPDSLGRKYLNAGRAWAWQWVFPATRTYIHPETQERRRHHLHETVLQRAVHAAVVAAGITKQVSCHTFRHNADPPAGGRVRRPAGRSRTTSPPQRR